MATNTTNLGLIKPSDSEFQDASVLNANMDTLDSAFGVSTVTLGFTPSSNWTYASVVADTPTLMRYNKLVRMTGRVRKTTGYGNTDKFQWTTIPSGYRPSSLQKAFSQNLVASGGGGAKGPAFQLVIGSDGVSTLTMLDPTETGAPVFNINTWIIMDCMWICD